MNQPKPLIFRIQHTTGSWILRHPQIPQPIIQLPEREQIIQLLPIYFNKLKQNAIVKISDEFGRVMEERVFN